MSSSRRPIPALYIGIVMFAIGLFVATLLHSGRGLQQTTDPASENAAEAPLFRLDGDSVTRSSLSFAYASELHALDVQMEERRRQVLRLAAFDEYLEKQAGGDVDKMARLKADILDVPPPTEDEVRRFYEANSDRIGKPLEDVQAIIASALQQERSQKVRNEMVSWLESEGRLVFPSVTTFQPVAQFDLSEAPIRGKAEATVEVVEFADYRCSHCRKASHTLKELQQSTDGAFRWVMLDFPILGGLSRDLAIGAYCAARQDHFWEYHDTLFADQSNLNPQSPINTAQSLGLDQAQFSECLASENASAFVDRSQKQALELGLRGTPGIFINGQSYDNGNLEQDLADAVRSAIRRASQGDTGASSPAS